MQAISVVVVSRGRPAALRRCLRGLEQLYHPRFEIIVVADPVSLAGIADWPGRDEIRIVEFDRPNISASRNLGIAAAAGEIVAFLDDDAVPEPTWLDHLSRAFDLSHVVAAGGFVIGRNGISHQWRGRSIDPLGWQHDLDVPQDAVTVPEPPPGQAVRTEGTNCAFRRKTLIALGGFDTAFRFYMDESDLNIRIRKAGLATAIVPMALVHHGVSASPRRRGDRMPIDLGDIGSSHAIFLRKHARPDQHEMALEALRKEQWRRLVDHLIRGNCEPRDLTRLMTGLKAGIERGLDADLPAHAVPPDEGAGFAAFRPLARPSGAVLHAGRSWDRGRVTRAAKASAAAGQVTTAILLSPTALFHRIRFTEDGYWLQTGGTFGKSLRTQKILQFPSFSRRIFLEEVRIQAARWPIDLKKAGSRRTTT